MFFPLFMLYKMQILFDIVYTKMRLQFNEEHSNNIIFNKEYSKIL